MLQAEQPPRIGQAAGSFQEIQDEWESFLDIQAGTSRTRRDHSRISKTGGDHSRNLIRDIQDNSENSLAPTERFGMHQTRSETELVGLEDTHPIYIYACFLIRACK